MLSVFGVQRALPLQPGPPLRLRLTTALQTRLTGGSKPAKRPGRAGPFSLCCLHSCSAAQPANLLAPVDCPQEVAEAYGLSRERIRQIEDKALKVRSSVP